MVRIVANEKITTLSERQGLKVKVKKLMKFIRLGSKNFNVNTYLIQYNSIFSILM